MWITVNMLGRPDNGVILASYLGSFLTAGAFLAIGSCISALTKNQVIAFIVAAAVCFLLVMSGARDGAQRVPALGAALPDRGHLLAQLPHALRGLHQGHLLAARISIFYASVIGFALFANKIILDQRKAA